LIDICEVISQDPLRSGVLSQGFADLPSTTTLYANWWFRPVAARTLKSRISLTRRDGRNSAAPAS